MRIATAGSIPIPMRPLPPTSTHTGTVSNAARLSLGREDKRNWICQDLSCAGLSNSGCLQVDDSPDAPESADTSSLVEITD